MRWNVFPASSPRILYTRGGGDWWEFTRNVVSDADSFDSDRLWIGAMTSPSRHISQHFANHVKDVKECKKSIEYILERNAHLLPGPEFGRNLRSSIEGESLLLHKDDFDALRFVLAFLVCVCVGNPCSEGLLSHVQFLVTVPNLQAGAHGILDPPCATKLRSWMGYQGWSPWRTCSWSRCSFIIQAFWWLSGYYFLSYAWDNSRNRSPLRIFPVFTHFCDFCPMWTKTAFLN